MLKLRIMRWARHMALMRTEGMHVGYLCESQKERDHKADQFVGWRIKLRQILERLCGVVWTGLIWLRIGTSRWLL
jgi:hypothetical protein